MKIVVDPEKCRASGECIRICPQNAITIIDGLATVDKISATWMGFASRPVHMRPLVILKRNDFMMLEEAIKTAFLKKVDIATMYHYLYRE